MLQLRCVSHLSLTRYRVGGHPMHRDLLEWEAITAIPWNHQLATPIFWIAPNA